MSTLNPERAELVLDQVAEAIYKTIFFEELGPHGTIERATYRCAAWAALKAGADAFRGGARHD